MISVLIPTRGNPLAASHALHSLDTRKVGEVEYVLRLDHDDDSLHDYVASVKTYRAVTLVGRRYGGMKSINEFLWEAFCVSTGDILIPWNDDMLMLTDGWDEVVAAGVDADRPHIRFMQPQQHWPWSMPVVNRPLLEMLGHFSLHTCYDAWLHAMAYHTTVKQGSVAARRSDGVIPVGTVVNLRTNLDKLQVDVSHIRGSKEMKYPTWPGGKGSNLLADCERYAAFRAGDPPKVYSEGCEWNP